MEAVYETSLSKLPEGEWRQISNRWARGIDWYVVKIGRKWSPMPSLGNFPLYRTKTEAGRVADMLVLAEGRHRAAIAKATGAAP